MFAKHLLSFIANSKKLLHTCNYRDVISSKYLHFSRIFVTLLLFSETPAKWLKFLAFNKYFPVGYIIVLVRQHCPYIMCVCPCTQKISRKYVRVVRSRYLLFLSRFYTSPLPLPFSFSLLSLSPSRLLSLLCSRKLF